MRLDGSQLTVSATDLANHLGCRHLSTLDRAEAEHRIRSPVFNDPALAVLIQRGFEHERAYLEYLGSLGLGVERIEKDDVASGVTGGADRTAAAMRAGRDLIVQAQLTSGRWHGRADILRRVAHPSALGAWSYEVVDTKLARETRAGTILQLCLYSEVVAELQGELPVAMHVVSPAREDIHAPTPAPAVGTGGFGVESFRVHDYLAYYRLVKSRLQVAVDRAVDDAAAVTYPDPVPQCDICRWWSQCDRRRRNDDHLSLVAGITRLQRRELQHWDVDTLARLAVLPVPLEHAPRRGTPESYVRVREQARVQYEGREKSAPIHELLPREPGFGFARLPEPSPGDLFFDVEGDPFVGTAGLEYLLGCVEVLAEGGGLRYEGRWAFDAAGERAAFEGFIDDVMARWARDPGLHIYHFTPYDPSALKRLMGRYATRVDEMDRMLRAGVFVDLHAIVRQALRASVEQYSLKGLEAFYGYVRATPLTDAALHKRALEQALELAFRTDVTEIMQRVVQDYNREDCESTLRLRNWLEALRAECVAAGETIDRPAVKAGDASDKVKEDVERRRALAARLLEGVPDDAAARTPEQQALWILAQLLEYHDREAKVVWWEFFRLRDLAPEDLVGERSGLGGLEFVEDRGPEKRSRVHRYRFPRQVTDLRPGKKLCSGDAFGTSEETNNKVGEVHAIDLHAGTIDIKKAAKAVGVHPKSVFEFSEVSAEALAESLFRLSEWVAENGIDGDGLYRAGRDLLLRRPPRLEREVGRLQRDGEATLDAARRLAGELAGGVLPIQGPPGAGKTYTGARMIVDLVRQGRRVGITAVSHKVIRNLLDEVVAAAQTEKMDVQCAQKIRKGDPVIEAPHIRQLTESEDILADLQTGAAQVAAGTAWLWATPEFVGSIDVLFVDEAGQMALAPVLSAAPAARNIVLLGDPQQLEQPQKGSHPEGTEVSALEHLLGGGQTIESDRGLFLGETWRLHPAICAFTSELFYEDRLKPIAGLERQAITGPTRFAGTGLWFEPVEHEGNQSSAPEEVERVAEIVGELTRGGVQWVDRHGVARSLTLEEILIVAPYNAQVADLESRLPGAQVGTVDKFQGREAPVVIYSMATSNPEDAPRGMEFLYSLNRLNVATSRARCAAILVASPRLFDPECRSPRQMQLANAYCRYLELARVV